MGVPANQPEFIQIAGTSAALNRSVMSKLHSKLHLPHLHSSSKRGSSSDTASAAVSEKDREQALQDCADDAETVIDETATTATAPDEAHDETAESVTPDKQGFRERLRHSLPHRKSSA
jgi:hypothetical protein